jgi:colanic acid biosynthesis glycosyl transferase WcaI
MKRDRSLKILILGLNYAPEIVGIAVYTAGLAEALAGRGHDVRVIAGKPYYPAWSVAEDFRGGWFRTGMANGVTVTRVAHYVPKRPNGVRRVLHHLSFALSGMLPLLAQARTQRPDIVLTIAPSLVAAPFARLAAALCGAKSWLHVQDFEVEAAVATGLVNADGFGVRAALAFENWVLGMFDRVSAISPAMCRKLGQKGVAADRIAEFRNWADVENVRPLQSVSPYRSEWGVDTRHVALYSGNIANKQGIGVVVDAAQRLKHRDDLTFVICGDGSNRAELESRAGELANVVIRDLQPKERLGDLLGLATVHLLPQLASAADLVLPSKLTNMLASGRATVACAHPGTGLAAEVEGCGLVVPPEDDEAFADAIERLIDNEPERAFFGTAARRRAEKRWEQDAIVDGLERRLRECLEETKAAPAWWTYKTRGARAGDTPPKG